MSEHLGEQTPNLKYPLLAGERLVDIIQHPVREYHDYPSALTQMMRITGVDTPERIGKNGPSVASLAFDVSVRTSVEPGKSPLESDEDALPAPEHLRLYETLFGRDALQAAIDLISSHPELARATTLRLAELQGVETSRARQEERGRIVHEARDPSDPIAVELTERLGWEWPFYGSVDATPLFIRTVAAYCRESEEGCAFLAETYHDLEGTERDMGYAVDMAIDWILRKLDESPNTLLEFQHLPPANPKSNEWIGAWNETWNDSWDAYHHADGSLANHDSGIASVETQATTYEALLDAAELYENTLNKLDKAKLLRQKAADLKDAIDKHLWTEDKGGYYVRGADYDTEGNMRQMKIRSSNMGHVINSRLLEDGGAESERKFDSVMQQILSPEMLNTSGIRTLATDEVRFRPGAYHNGSVWPWDTHHTAKGIRRHGNRIVNIPYTTLDGRHLESITCNDIADDLDKRLLNVVNTVKIFPEYVRGDAITTPTLNTKTVVLYDEVHDYKYKREQPPQEVQAWTVAVILAIKRRIDRHARQRMQAEAEARKS